MMTLVLTDLCPERARHVDDPVVAAVVQVAVDDDLEVGRRVKVEGGLADVACVLPFKVLALHI